MNFINNFKLIMLLTCVVLIIRTTETTKEDILDRVENLFKNKGITKFVAELTTLTVGIRNLKENYNRFLSKQCREDLRKIVERLRNGEDSGFQFIDAFEKLPYSDLLPGSRSVCERVNQSVALHKQDLIKMQYYTLNYKSVIPISLKLGVCLPIQCSIKNINFLLKSFLGNSFISPKENIWTSPSFLLCFSLVLLPIFLMVLGTIYDLKIYSPRRSVYSSVYYIKDKLRKKHYGIKQSMISKGSNLEKVLLCFSAYTNGKKLLKLEYNDDKLACLHGLRVIATLAVIYAHTLVFGVNIDNPLAIITAISRGPFLFFSSSFSINLFLITSGILLSYTFLTIRGKGGKIVWFQFYFDRYYRISLLSWFVSFVIEWGIMPKILDGPNDRFIRTIPENCANNWWRNILYIQNYCNLVNICSHVTWYLATDMQLYCISPIFLICMRRSKKCGIIVCLIAILAASLYTCLLSYKKKYTLLIINRNTFKQLNESSTLIHTLYIRPYYRIISYVIGMICGWILYGTTRKVILSQAKVVFLWSIVFIFCIPVMLVLEYNHSLNVGATIIYIMCHSILWSSGLAILIYLCVQGYGGFINSILSWKGWAPLSRLSFSIYLIQYFILIFMFNISGKLNHFSLPGLLFNSLAAFLLSVFGGAVIHLAIEVPLMRLRQTFLKSKRK